MVKHTLQKDDIAFAKKLANRFLNSCCLRGLERDDVYSVALVALCEAADRYRPGGNAQFKSFAFLRVRGALFDLVKRMHKLTHCEYVVLSEDLPSGELFEDPNELQNSRKTIDAILSRIASIEREIILRKYFYGQTFQEIGDTMGGRSVSWVSKLHTNALDNLREQILV
jgi:RNA polymerase sigma factor (sigma-70 family)